MMPLHRPDAGWDRPAQTRARTHHPLRPQQPVHLLCPPHLGCALLPV